jgi:calcineurin-like phosphoesterase family protein
MIDIEKIRAGRSWVISDTHLGHPGIVRHCFRPGWHEHHIDTERHNQLMHAAWLERIRSGDQVLHLGDVAFKADGIERWCAGLTGDVTVVRGNHDTDESVKLMRELGWTVVDALSIEWTALVGGAEHAVTVRCTHYPLDPLAPGEVNLHGHTHGNPSGVRTGRHIDASVDNTWGYARPLGATLDKAAWLVHGQRKGRRADTARNEARVRQALADNVVR